MANFKTVFLGTENSETNLVEMQCFHNVNDEIFITIKDTSINHNYNEQYICLDVSTAIKLAKTIRTHINLIKS